MKSYSCSSSQDQMKNSRYLSVKTFVKSKNTKFKNIDIVAVWKKKQKKICYRKIQKGPISRKKLYKKYIKVTVL